jgi:hypothetical protein
MKIVVEKSLVDPDDDVIRMIDENDVSFCNIYKGGQIVFPETYNWTRFLHKGLPAETFYFLVKMLKEQEGKNDVAPGN